MRPKYQGRVSGACMPNCRSHCPAAGGRVVPVRKPGTTALLLLLTALLGCDNTAYVGLIRGRLRSLVDCPVAGGLRWELGGTPGRLVLSRLFCGPCAPHSVLHICGAARGIVWAHAVEKCMCAWAMRHACRRMVTVSSIGTLMVGGDTSAQSCSASRDISTSVVLFWLGVSNAAACPAAAGSHRAAC